MNTIIINNKTYTSEHNISIVNGKIICQGDYYINGKLSTEHENKNEPISNTLVIPLKQSLSKIKNQHFDIEININPNTNEDNIVVTIENVTYSLEKITKKLNSLTKNNTLDFSNIEFPINKIKINAKSLDILENLGIGNVFGTISQNHDSLTIYNTGSGDIKLSGDLNYANINNQGVGDINLKDLYIQETMFLNSGTGSLKLWTHSIKKSSITGIGDVCIHTDKQNHSSFLPFISVTGLSEINFKSKNTYNSQNAYRLSHNSEYIYKKSDIPSYEDSASLEDEEDCDNSNSLNNKKNSIEEVQAFSFTKDSEPKPMYLNGLEKFFKTEGFFNKRIVDFSQTINFLINLKGEKDKSLNPLNFALQYNTSKKLNLNSKQFDYLLFKSNLKQTTLYSENSLMKAFEFNHESQLNQKQFDYLISNSNLNQINQIGDTPLFMALKYIKFTDLSNDNWIKLIKESDLLLFNKYNYNIQKNLFDIIINLDDIKLSNQFLSAISFDNLFSNIQKNEYFILFLEDNYLNLSRSNQKNIDYILATLEIDNNKKLNADDYLKHENEAQNKKLYKYISKEKETKPTHTELLKKIKELEATNEILLEEQKSNNILKRKKLI